MTPLVPDRRAQRRELIVGSILLAFAVAWTVTVYYTVPTGRGPSVGPRAFPLFLGGGLIFLSALMIISALRNAVAPGDDDGAGDGEPPLPPIGLWPQLRIAGSVAAILMAYGWLMQNAGFVLATILVVSFTLWVVIGVRRPLLVIGMSLGITAGCWLAFGKLLGAYMPRGTWLTYFF